MTSHAYYRGQDDAIAALDNAYSLGLHGVPVVFNVEDDGDPEIREYMEGVWSMIPDALFCHADEAAA